MYHYRGQQLPPMARRLLMSAPWQEFASVREDGETIAIGRVAADAGWAGITAIETDPRHRRRGLATAVTAALATLAVEHGRDGAVPAGRGRQRGGADSLRAAWASPGITGITTASRPDRPRDKAG